VRRLFFCLPDCSELRTGVKFVQLLPQTVEQGKHYACGLEKDFHPSGETYALSDMYGDLNRRPSLADTAEEVRCA
jgi:hypothetical protein